MTAYCSTALPSKVAWEEGQERALILEAAARVVAVSFRVNGSEWMRIASDGSLGVGISSPNTKVSWQVNGIRQDPWANANRIPAVEAKPATESGAYMHLEAYGQPESRASERGTCPIVPLTSRRMRHGSKPPPPVRRWL